MVKMRVVVESGRIEAVEFDHIEVVESGRIEVVEVVE